MRTEVAFRTPETNSLLLRRWVPSVFLAIAASLVPWTAWLFYSLPPHKVASHWAIAWGGFDIALGLSLAATGFLVLRALPLSEVSATVTATMLACDAWFDVLTSSGGWDLTQALAGALLVELPLAILCVLIARNFGTRATLRTD